MEGRPTEAPGVFATTHWSLIVAAKGTLSSPGAEALDSLCRAYWYPLYAYVRRAGNAPEDAKDLTQSFLFQWVQKEAIQLADRERGRFRTFLLSSLKNFLVDQNRRRTAWKRGGREAFEPLEGNEGESRYGFEPSDPESPDLLYDRGWARMLLEQALARLRSELSSSKHAPGFDALKSYIWGERSGFSCAELGRELGISEEAAKKLAQRTRARFAEILREQIAETVTTPTELEDELRYLASLLR